MTTELLLEIKEYIEDMEVKVDGEWGCCRKLQQLIKDKEMPNIYRKVLKEIKANHANPT